jgi:serine/threonine-protein kinase
MPGSSSLESPADSAREPVPATTVREQLARVVNSPGFVSSVRLCRFLTHIVNRTIDRDPDSLKEFSIAMEVFDRTADYDPNIDAIVRVEARRLRSKLKTYYEDGPGRSDPVLIGLRPGSYVPIFRWLERGPQEHQQEAAAGIETRRGSIAVLPFVNMSPEPEQDYFCDGISEEIINALTRVSGLNVIARTSAFQFKGVAIDIREVGQRLGADLVIEGSVRKAGMQLRITAQAIHTESGHHLWSETFRRELKDIFAIQEEIAESVSSLLRLHRPEVRVRLPARNIDAYTRYLRARFLIHQQSPEALGSALQQLREVVELFPDYAPAYSGIAAASGLLCLFGEVCGRDVYPDIKANAERGYALDPESGETCTILGGLRAWFEYRWGDADTLYERALKMQPGHAPTHMFRAMALLCQGNVDAAESGVRRSTELDPLSASDCARMAYVHYVQEDYEKAVQHLKNSFELDRDYPEARFYTGLLHFQREDYESVTQYLSGSQAPLDIGLMAAAYARKGNEARARKCREALGRLAERRYVTPLAEAFSGVSMGDHDLAFHRLEQAIEHKTNFVNMLAVEPFFAPLRSDARFSRLLKTLNLPF